MLSQPQVNLYACALRILINLLAWSKKNGKYINGTIKNMIDITTRNKPYWNRMFIEKRGDFFRKSESSPYRSVFVTSKNMKSVRL